MLACGTPDAVDSYLQAKQAAAWDEILANLSGTSEGGSSTLPTLFAVQDGELLTSTGDIVGRWKKYFEDLLNPTDLPSNEEAEAWDSSPVTEVKGSSQAPQWQGAWEVDEICPEYLKSLDVVGLSWLCNKLITSTGLQWDWGWIRGAGWTRGTGHGLVSGDRHMQYGGMAGGL
ncbi:hypothetical protein L3Q82_014513 [Scortum barcoo]|uniref:Uncharacterized protein n=1 Tax=Scortum barcoo TaxID=214431 RepID=A0ACB8VXQ4_9TELE|nr:hypothetical protein L3Q82_014513 [Scortum barcoo]